MELFELCRQQVQSAWREAHANDMTSPVVFLIDCADETGGIIARGLVGNEMVDEILRTAKKNAPATLVKCLPFEHCVKLPSLLGGLLAEPLASPPADDEMAVMIWAVGGVTSGIVRMSDKRIAEPSWN